MHEVTCRQKRTKRLRLRRKSNGHDLSSGKWMVTGSRVGLHKSCMCCNPRKGGEVRSRFHKMQRRLIQHQHLNVWSDGVQLHSIVDCNRESETHALATHLKLIRVKVIEFRCRAVIEDLKTWAAKVIAARLGMWSRTHTVRTQDFGCIKPGWGKIYCSSQRFIVARFSDRSCNWIAEFKWFRCATWSRCPGLMSGHFLLKPGSCVP